MEFKSVVINGMRRIGRRPWHCKDCKKLIHNPKNKPEARCWNCWTTHIRNHPESLSFYKGGKIFSKGYAWVIARNHPKKNRRHRVAEHRLVMESKLGRFLRSDEIVHHINGIETDNRPENLVLTTSREHMHKYHRRATHCKMCGKPGQMRRGYCLKHYTRWFESGFKGDAPAPDKPKRVCKICGGKNVAIGYCTNHYYQFVKRKRLGRA